MLRNVDKARQGEYSEAEEMEHLLEEGPVAKFNVSSGPSRYPNRLSSLHSILASKKLAFFNSLALFVLCISAFSTVISYSSKSNKVEQVHQSLSSLSEKRVTLQDYISQGQSFRRSSPDWKSTNVHLVMIASKVDDRFCKSVFSALVNGYPAPQVPFMNKTFEHGLVHKIEEFSNYAHKKAKDNDTILLIDGYDVIFQLSMDTMLSRIENMPYKIIVGADKRCWPQDASSPACQNVPQSELPNDIYGEKTDVDRWGSPWSRPIYVNSGTIAGRAVDLKPLLYSSNEALQAAYLAHNRVDDQEAISDLLVNKERGFNWTVDTTSTLFQTMIDGDVDLIWESNPDPLTPSTILSSKKSSQRKLNLSDMKFEKPEERLISHWRDRVLARNMRSNVIPASIHYAGVPTKKVFTQWWPFMWFADVSVRDSILKAFEAESQIGGAGIWAQDQWIPWKDVCGQYDLFA